jgi:hypothetical protein
LTLPQIQEGLGERTFAGASGLLWLSLSYARSDLAILLFFRNPGSFLPGLRKTNRNRLLAALHHSLMSGGRVKQYP